MERGMEILIRGVVVEDDVFMLPCVRDTSTVLLCGDVTDSEHLCANFVSVWW